ncbi:MULTISPECIES: hypothetical protein [unclassified Pseudomonas]|uniref:hypothetical protein n=1 Tax=unclassified Pseudomonas TaxID=196821 RepID=UPI000BD51A93|nr:MULTISPECIES: hypothetical protein [unclassified Pseudomonas]PVZ15709.1 hypothetical protein F474_02488 [Pseudomonas sp. URIL14HWK12:I12]PVZ25083.1 hypothetical protein F470_02143 [Pseudomonas sp. URIL14HWK12:I10]PVZ34929.1 hypothetical protein F472_02489 [Pseudomonas sp. URIL14HWK12:I11]SNZ09693.1 hypothetical protein SAMN05660463_01476 [Pseudomonas sp. URIL14HWK12:I9]
MTMTLPYAASKPAARPWLSVHVSTLMVWTAISLIVTETFSGALRYYLDQAHLAPLMYLPKALCSTMFALELLRVKVSRTFWVALLGLAASSVLAMLHGAAPENVLFSLFMYSPLLFGMVCGVHLEHRKRLLAWVIGLCLLASILGLLLDRYSVVPWKGYSYNLGDTELKGNTAWTTGDDDRLAGFTRQSTMAAMIIAIMALYLSAWTRSWLKLAVLFGASLGAVYMTTNKSTAAAFFFTLLLLPLLRAPLLSRLALCVVVGIGVALPVMGLTLDFDPLQAHGTSVLASFYDRLVNTWPNVYQQMSELGLDWSLFGAGFGLVGSSVSLFPVYGASGPAICDNTVLYLWAAFGLAGIALYVAVLPLMLELLRKRAPAAVAYLTITFCNVLVSWTTDVLELSLSNLFLGMAVSHVLLRSAMPAAAPLPVTAREAGHGRI